MRVSTMKGVSTGALVNKTDQPQKKPATRPKFEPPTLQRLGTLREMTRMFPGNGMDGGMGGMSFP